jgi:multiple sugar transport system permease protein
VSYLVLATLVVWTLAPLFWMATTPFKTNKEIYQTNLFIPSHLYLGNFQALLSGDFPIWLRNSAYVSTVTVILAVVVSALAAYAIGRLSFAGRQAMARSLIFVYLIPGTLLFIPLFTIVAALNLVDTPQSLQLVYLTFNVPFCTWLLVGYFKTLPQEIEEAALIDGCNRLQVLRHVILPLSLPALAVVALFSFTNSWNEFLYALVFTTSNQSKTAMVGLMSLYGDDVFFWGQMMAAAVLTTIPPVLIYILSQRWIIGGLTLGSVKG